MKNVLRLPLITIALAGTVTLVACSKKEDAANPRTITVQNQDDATNLVNAAEQLITPYTFAHADQVLDQALAKDPTNEKGLFLKALLKPVMALKGIARRIDPAVQKYGTPTQVESYKRDMKERIPKSAAADFLKAQSSKSIAAIADAQTLLEDVREGYLDIYTFIKKHPTAAFELRLNPYLFGKEIEDGYLDNCTVTEGADGKTFFNCNLENLAIRKVNAADLAMIAQMSAGAYLSLTPYAAYSMADTESLIIESNKRRDQGLAPLTDRQVTAMLDQSNEFGKLRSNNGLSKIALFGSDFTNSLKWAIENQSQLCPVLKNPDQLFPKEKRRPGFLFEQGICIEDTEAAYKAADKIAEALVKPIEIRAEDDYVSSFDLKKLTEGALTNLKNGKPVQFDRNGKAVRLQDSSLNGLFPNQDAEAFLITN
jgi:hypothetical protein